MVDQSCDTVTKVVHVLGARLPGASAPPCSRRQVRDVGETPRPTTSASEADEGDGVGGDGGTGFDLFGPDPTPMEDL